MNDTIGWVYTVLISWDTRTNVTSQSQMEKMGALIIIWLWWNRKQWEEWKNAKLLRGETKEFNSSRSLLENSVLNWMVVKIQNKVPIQMLRVGYL